MSALLVLADANILVNQRIRCKPSSLSVPCIMGVMLLSKEY
jgi:hypothetical protein